MSLSEDDLRDAAAEAGVPADQLRHSLALRESGALATASDGSLVGPPRRGQSATYVEGLVPTDPVGAQVAIRDSIEQQTGRSGHKQGNGDVDIVDDRGGVTYRVRSVDDGSAGAIVRIDVDPGQSQGDRALVLSGIAGTTVLLLVVGWAFSAATFLLGGLGVGALGALWTARSLSRQRNAVRSAHAVASRALSDAEHHRAALPAAPSSNDTPAPTD